MIGTLTQEEIDRASPGELRAEVALLRARVKGLMVDNDRLGTMAMVAVAARIDRIDEYRNASGDAVSLVSLCREEPEWAANTITRLKAMATAAEMGKMAPVYVLPRDPLTAADCMEVAAVRAIVDDLSEQADDPCAYGDGCPPFGGTRHGECRSCKARDLLVSFRAAMKAR